MCGRGVRASLIISSDTHFPVARQEVSRPGLVQTDRLMSRLFPVWAASEPGGWWPAGQGAAGTGCDTCDQSLSPSPTPRQTASNTHEIIANCHPKTLLASPWSALSSVDKYGLAEPETRWCNSPSRVSSSSLTFKSEHDYLKVRPHHSFRYWGIKKKKKLWIKNVWGSGRGRQFYA